MPHVVPFAGYRYAPKKIERLSEVVAPPSGRLALGEAELLHGRHPGHAIRIEAPISLSEESTADRARRAAEGWAAWKRDGWVIPEGPAFYRYDSTERDDGATRSVRGLFARVDVMTADLHLTAETWPRVVASRKELHGATGALSAPLVFLYEDDGQVARILGEAGPATITSEAGSRIETLAPLRAGARNEDLHEFFLKRPLLLLEGHHRLAALREIARERNLAHLYAPAVFFDRKTAGIRLVARSRLVVAGEKTQFNPETFLKGLRAHFDIETYAYKGAAQKEVELRNLLEEIETVGRVTHTFGLYLGGGAFHCLFLTDPDSYERNLEVPRSRRWKRADSVILEELVFGEVLKGKARTGLAVRPRDAVEMVDEREAQAAIFLLPPLLGDVVRLARGSELLPPRPFAVDPVPSTGLLVTELTTPVS